MQPVTSEPDEIVPENTPVGAGPIDIDTGSGDVNMPAAVAGFGGGFGGSQSVVQDNDQVSSVVGSNNTVNQTQDNSVQNFGGSGGKFKDMWMNKYFSA